MKKRKQENKALMESEEKSRYLFNPAPEPIAIIQNNRHVFVNEKFTELFKYTMQDVNKGLIIEDLVFGKDREIALGKLKDRFAGKKLDSEYTVVDIVAKDGKVFPCEATGSIIEYEGQPADLVIMRDMTKRKQMENALRESEEKYRTLFANAGDALFFMEVDPENRSWFIECNQRTLNLFGCESEDIIGKSPAVFSPEYQPDGKSSVEKTTELTRLVMEGQTQVFQWLHHRHDNKEPFWVEVNLTRLTVGGKPNYMQAVLRNITERKQAEDALQESEEKYRSLFETSKDAIMTLVPPDWKFTSGNMSTIKMFMAKDEHDFILKSPWDLSPEYQPDGQLSLDKGKEMIEKAMTAGSNFFEWTHKRLNDEEFSATVLLSRVELKDKHFLQAVVRNITERKQAEEVIHNLSRQLIISQESERQMISYELHDSVAQDLSFSKITCEMLLKYKSLTPGARKQILELSVTLQKILKGVRDLSYELRPPGLENLGLASTIYQFCEDFSEKTGIRVDLQSAGMEKLNLNYNTKINLYRLLQEGLNNVKKHADAGNVKVRLISSFPNIILRIDDDGKGFDLKERLAKTSSEKRIGLSSMAHRVDLLAGRINIESIPGKGTKVFIEIPQK